MLMLSDAGPWPRDGPGGAGNLSAAFGAFLPQKLRGGGMGRRCAEAGPSDPPSKAERRWGVVEQRGSGQHCEHVRMFSRGTAGGPSSLPQPSRPTATPFGRQLARRVIRVCSHLGCQK